MAGSRTVTLNVIGNSTGAQQALKAVGDHAEANSKRMSGAFSGVLSTLNSSGVLGPFGEAIEKVSGAFDKMGEHGKAAGAKLMGIGAAGVGIGSLFTAIGDKDKAASQQLKASVEAIGGSYDDAKEKFEKVIKSNEKFGDSAKTTQDALAILTTGLHGADKATASMSDVLNLAAKRHEDLTAAATDWVKINEGKGTKILATLGLLHESTGKAMEKVSKIQKEVTTSDENAAKAKEKLADLVQRLQGVTEPTIAQQQALRHAHEDVTEATNKAAEAHKKLTDYQDAMKGSASQLTDVQKVHNVVQGQAAAAADTFSGHMKALKTEIEDQAAKIGQKYGPAITGAAAGMTVLGSGVEVASGILGKFKRAQEGATVATEGLTVATDAEAVSEGLALAPILLIVAGVAALGIALYELWKHWDTVWGWIKGAAGHAKDWILDRWHDLIDFIKGIPGKISSAAVGMFDGIKDAFKSALNWLIDKWNGLHFGIPSIDTHIPGIGKIGGFDIGVPQIPRFAAGGIVPGAYGDPMLAIVHGGETVIPVGGGGGTTTVNQTIVAGPGMDIPALAAEVRRQFLQAGRGNVNVGLT